MLSVSIVLNLTYTCAQTIVDLPFALIQYPYFWFCSVLFSLKLFVRFSRFAMSAFKPEILLVPILFVFTCLHLLLSPALTLFAVCLDIIREKQLEYISSGNLDNRGRTKQELGAVALSDVCDRFKDLSKKVLAVEQKRQQPGSSLLKKRISGYEDSSIESAQKAMNDKILEMDVKLSRMEDALKTLVETVAMR